MSSFNEGKEILVTMVLEILGRPKEHIVETLKEIIKQMGEEKGVKVQDSIVNEPVLVKDQKDLYTTFSEVEMKIEDIRTLLGIIFKYMPAHLEIIYPESIKLDNVSLGETLSELTRRLHAYDEVARVLQNENFIMREKLKEFIDEKKNKKEEKK